MGLLTIGVSAGLYDENRACAVLPCVVAVMGMLDRLATLSFGSFVLSVLSVTIF